MSNGKIAADTISVFRSGLDLSSNESSQLRRTIGELEDGISARDVTLEQQSQYILEQAAEIAELQGEVLRERNKMTPDQLKAAHLEKLQETNRYMEHIVEEMEDSFYHVFSALLECLDGTLDALSQLPATAETNLVYSRAKKEIQAIKRSKQSHTVSPANALRQLSDLHAGLSRFISSRPNLTLKRAEHYRACLLIETLDRDSKAKSLNSPEAAKILSTAEEKPVSTKQARRAMVWAAKLRPDKVSLNKRGFGAGKSWRLCKLGEIDNVGADKK